MVICKNCWTEVDDAEKLFFSGQNFENNNNSNDKKESSSSESFCTKYGNELSSDDLFCSKCRTKVNQGLKC